MKRLCCLFFLTVLELSVQQKKRKANSSQEELKNSQGCEELSTVLATIRPHFCIFLGTILRSLRNFSIRLGRFPLTFEQWEAGRGILNAYAVHNHSVFDSRRSGIVIRFSLARFCMISLYQAKEQSWSDYQVTEKNRQLYLVPTLNAKPIQLQPVTNWNQLMTNFSKAVDCPIANVPFAFYPPENPKPRNQAAEELYFISYDLAICLKTLREFFDVIDLIIIQDKDIDPNFVTPKKCEEMKSRLKQLGEYLGPLQKAKPEKAQKYQKLKVRCEILLQTRKVQAVLEAQAAKR